MKFKSRFRIASAIIGATGILCLGFTGVASAHSGIYSRFNYCPSTNSSVFKCLQSVTKGGKVTLGKKTVPIVNPVTLQGGVSKGRIENEEVVETLYAATNGETLSKTPQPVPGGLTGLVNCKEIHLGLLRVSCESIFENGLTGVNATVELARPVNEIVVSEQNLAFEEGTALRLPVRVHLENPLLGSTCYVGSSSSPIIWNLTTGATKPPAGTAPISGSAGELLFPEPGFTEFQNASLVDNAWSAPSASGCGGFLVEYILDPIIDSSVGVPSGAGKNVAALEKTQISEAQAALVDQH